MAIDVARARAETPGCEHVTHFNNAGASLMPTPVLDAMAEHLALEARIGGYEAADAAEAEWEATYDAIAELINCDRSEIAVVENATRAWDMAFYSLSFEAGDRILTAKAEYVSNYLAYLQVARRHGAVIDVVPNDDMGQLSVRALEDMLDERVKLIAITHVPTNGGLVNPAAAVGRIARAAGVVYMLDACQSAGQLRLDVEELGCDVLAATGRKFLRAPRGTGFLYARRELIEQVEPPLVDVRAATWEPGGRFTLRDDARRFESWETNYATKIALGEAVRYAMRWGIDEIEARDRRLAEELRARLSAIDGVEVLDLGAEKCAIVSFSVEGVDAGDVKGWLRRRAVNVSVATAGDTRLDMEERGYNEFVRASVHYFNSEAELTALVDGVATVAAAARQAERAAPSCR